MNLLVSIIVPIYNVEKYLSKCLNSIINQTYSNIEIILVNDGSTDGCDKICKNFISLDKRIKYFIKKNGGLSSARNYGIKKSHGKYICFIDSDDYIDKNYVKKLLTFSIENNCDITICGYKEIDLSVLPNKSKPINRYPSDIRENRVIDRKSAWEEWYLKRKDCNDYSYIVAFTKLFKKDIFKHFKFKNTIHEDEFSILKIFHISKRIGVINDLLYYYRRNRPGSIMYYSLQNQEKRDSIIFKFSIERSAYFIKNRFPIKIIEKEKDCFNWIEKYFNISRKLKLIYWFKVRYVIRYYKKNNLIEQSLYKKFLKSQFKPIYKVYRIIKKTTTKFYLKINRNKHNKLIVLANNKIIRKKIINISKIFNLKNQKNKFFCKNKPPLFLQKYDLLVYINGTNLSTFLKQKKLIENTIGILTDSIECINYLKKYNIKNFFYISNENEKLYSQIFNNKTSELIYLIGRVLLYYDFIKFDEFLNKTKDLININKNKICINLPESHERRDSFNKNKLKNFIYFPAIKNKIGWLGCAQTYKYISNVLIKKRNDYYQIFEDDSIIKDIYYKNINYILDIAKKKSIDLICCYTTYLFPSKKKHNILKVKDVFLISQSALVSEVFNIYSKKFLQIMSTYNEELIDPNNNVDYQMDQYTSKNSKNMKIYVTCPYLVEHSPNLISDINGIKNYELCYNKDADQNEKNLKSFVLKKMKKSKKNNNIINLT